MPQDTNIGIEFFRRVLFLPEKLPQTAQIGVTNRCNFSCKMCHRTDLKLPDRDMDFDIFETSIRKLKGVKYIILTGWGEPFMHTRLMDMIHICVEKNFSVRITSNGSLLNEETIENILDSRLDSITFSVEGIKSGVESLGHPITNQLKNIQLLLKRKRERNSGLHVFLQSIYHKGGESHLYDVVDFAISNRVDRMRISRLSTRFHSFERPDVIEEKMLIKNIETRLKGSGVGIDFLPFRALDGLTAKFYSKVYFLMHRLGKYCLRTYGDVYIDLSGAVTPCCALPHYVVGDLLAEDLFSIWNGKRMKRFRENQKKICGDCDILAVNIR